MPKRIPVSLNHFAIIFSSLAVYMSACHKTEDPEVFPQVYKYEQLDFAPSRYYVLTENSYNEISAAGNYLDYDEFLAEELDIFGWEFEIEKLELLNDDSLHMYFFDYLDIMPTDTVVPYTRDGNKIVFEPLVSFYNFYLDEGNNAARVKLPNVQHSKELPSGVTDYSSVDISINGEEMDVAAIIAHRRTKYNLHAGDTIAINNSSYLYPRQ
ncbi:MAG TPA: hypothetical protein PLO67_02515 [Saprospiraceae bacterium]|nr:hypothetical protein [Saprospiraceae bacterium]HPI06440.1 hypothetical protein [Saprospiraceae bacterium]